MSRARISGPAWWLRHRRLGGLIGGCLLATALALLWQLSHPPMRAPMIIAGSSLMQPLIQALAQQFDQASYDVQVESGGSVAGVVAVRHGAIDLAMVSHPVPGLFADVQTRQYLLARNSIAFIVHRNAPVQALSQEHIRRIFTGNLRNWQALGGPDAPIQVVAQRPPSATTQFIEEVVLGYHPITHHAQQVSHAKDIVTAIERNPYAIGYVSLQDSPAQSSFIRLEIEGVPFSRATILSGRYPYIQDLYLVGYGKSTAAEQDFLQFIRSTQAQEIIEQHNLVSVY